jgi:DNA primase
MSDTVEKIKERLSIKDVVDPYVKLTRAGKYWKGLSPFTKEKTPSFFVSPDRGLYHCFSTGKGGDMFTFIQEMEGVDFRGSLKILAEKAGVPLVYESPQKSDEREQVMKALSLAEEYFISRLSSRAEAKKYLLNRGLTEKIIESWRIGYAENEWRALSDALQEKGVSEVILERAGLIKKPDSENAEQANTKRPYDRFRGRVMFPIFDVSNRIVGFSGRILVEDKKQPGAKYLNSPETEVFDKSRALYGIHVAREGIRALGSAILVEGQLDLLLAHQAGYRNTVATSGTAFTERHAELLKRYTQNLLIAYDGDRAGVAAAGRAASIALQAGMNVKVAKFPPGQDPADLLSRTPDVFKQCIREAVHIVDFYISHITDAKYDPRTFRLEVSRTVLPFVALIPNKIDQAHFVKRVAEALSVSEDAVKGELSKLLKPTVGARMPSAEAVHEPFLSRVDTVERLAFGLYLLFVERGAVEEKTQAEQVLRECVGDARFEELLNSVDIHRPALFEADLFLTRDTPEDARDAIADAYADLKRESLHETYRTALSGLRAAESAGNHEEAEKHMAELARLATHIK